MEGSLVPPRPSDLFFTQDDELRGWSLLPPLQNCQHREISPLDLSHPDPQPTAKPSNSANMSAQSKAKLSAMQVAADKIRAIKEGSTLEALQMFQSQITGVHSTFALYLTGSKNMILKIGGVFLKTPVDGSFSDETLQKIVELTECVTAFFTEMQGAYQEEIGKILDVEKQLPALHSGIEKKFLSKTLKTWMQAIIPNLKKVTSEEHNLLACISVLYENVHKQYLVRVQAHEVLLLTVSAPFEALHHSIEKTLELYTEIVGHNFYFKKQMQPLITRMTNSRELAAERLAFKKLKDRLDKEVLSWEWGVGEEKESPGDVFGGEKKALGGTPGGVKKENIGFKSNEGENGGT